MQITVNIPNFDRTYTERVTPARYQLHLLSLKTDQTMFMDFESPEQALEWLEKTKQLVQKDIEQLQGGETHELRRVHRLGRAIG